ncbi:MAG: 1-acyl-sn-glycerol-3-phosphate acyltransferase [Paracoccaceae bacterium]
MFRAVEVPMWLLVLIVGFAAVSFATHFLFPSVRWFFRRRAERALAQLNARLDRKIDLFKLARHSDMVARLVHDGRVMEAVADHAAATGVPAQVAFEEARGYAHEIVPGFSATVYFGFGTRAARWLSLLLYRVRVGKVDAALGMIDPKATIVFVMNHRSNLDYVLVTWLMAGRSAVSYAVGEWARVWPLSWLIRSMGAYFIRRGDRNTLYRRILARYVQMATEEGTTQAMFPEGGLSLDGRVGPARLGLLSYIVEGWRPDARDVVFVPVGLAYDRVLEDRVLIAAAAAGKRQFRNRPLWVAGHALRFLWLRWLGRSRGFGSAAVGFGAPVSLRAYLAEGHEAPVEALAADLMARIRAVVPVLPVPLVAAAVVSGAVGRAALLDRVAEMVARLEAAGAVLRLAPQGLEQTLDEGLAPLVARGVLRPDLTPEPSQAALLAFYAAEIPEM